ncbi:hypothetical protein H5410_041705 [Solanum commersonii]|uniref:Uncharacterized protein n=1 Tax=Solanum commersonii TaxID=4109 RepID=A0A9J5XUC1_SOLCO|nr:hypothetical protein H5410_041705 [Solanum commersonii]
MPNKPYKFQRVYLCFAACKEAFKIGCHRIVGVDGCWLKGPMYGNKLLTTVGLDANNNIFLNALRAAANASTVEFFKICIEKMHELDVEVVAWLNEKPLTEWSKSHFSTGAKCDIKSILHNNESAAAAFISKNQISGIMRFLKHRLRTIGMWTYKTESVVVEN